MSLLWETRMFLDERYQPDGYNIGININEPGGQTVFHTHIHIIPRYKDDKLVMWGEQETTEEDRALFAQKMIMHLD